MNLPVVTHPLGWVILGGAGFLAYKAGKKSGKKTQDDAAKPSLSDRVVKETMKAVYKTQKGASAGLEKAKEKCGNLWAEAKTEANATADNS
jgi:hypothetical protein